ncbi:MAG: signal peptide peptidase SppA [Bacteroidales bacterium]|nr:signal peptide peptidase SppA [Bacteroidales bacterium]
MKNFLKTFLASFTAMIIFGAICFAIISSLLSGLESLFDFGKKPVTMPSEAILTIDLSQIALQEQTEEAPLLEVIAGNPVVQPMGILDVVAAVNAAAFDPSVKYILLKPDGVTGGMAQIEELRKSLGKFRESGKAVVSYIENPTNGGYYLASVSDKIYMTPHDGGLNALNGISSQMIFLKDILDRMGVNVQLIRHGKFKSAGEMFVRNSSSKENMQQNQELISSMWESWCDKIAQARGLEPEEINTMLDNLELNLPTDFLEKGLVDELMTEDQLQEKLSVLYMADSYDEVKSISIQDYAQLNVAGNPEGKNKIAVIYAEGNIVDGYAIEDVAGDRFVKIIQKIRQDDDVKAAVLRVNSPGGSVLASEKIKAQIDSLSQKIPVIASYGDYAASGGYWISSSCDFIYANETTITGSIGVFSLIPDFKKTLNDKLHVNVTSVNSNEHSDMYSMLRPLSQNEIAHMQNSVEHIYDRFTKIVAEGRGLRTEYVDSVGQGRIWTGSQALELGLIDAIGSIDEALIHAAMLTGSTDGFDNIEVVEYPKPITSMDIITSLFTGEDPTQIAESVKLTGPVMDVIRAFRNWTESQSGKIYARLPYAIDIK